MKKKIITLSVMAPLVVGDPKDPDGDASAEAWKKLDHQLEQLKKYGVYGVSIDMWWGLVEYADGKFSWGYYRKLIQHIINAGLKATVIISLHQCGGNVGDDRFVAIPEYIWEKLKALVPSGKVDAVRYVSEQGNVCKEYVAAWATHLVLPFYVRFMTAFREEFKGLADHISELNISLGPAGELRYPSLNSHDKNVDWPNRGALQCYSELAVESLREEVIGKYNDEAGIEKAWGKRYGRGEINPPKNANAFFEKGEHRKLQYGKDLFDWYHKSLIKHGRLVLNAALEVFGPGTAFANTDIGAKIPGLHWLLGLWEDEKIVLHNRLAEVPAGLIMTSGDDWDSDEKGRGYRSIVGLFAELQKAHPERRIVLHFTCLEMADGGDGVTQDYSLAKSLVGWVGQEAVRQGVTIKGENALGWNLPYEGSWKRMRAALALPGQDGVYEGLTILRMGELLDSDVAKAELAKTVALIKGEETATAADAAGDAAPSQGDHAGSNALPEAAVAVPAPETAAVTGK